MLLATQCYRYNRFGPCRYNSTRMRISGECVCIVAASKLTTPLSLSHHLLPLSHETKSYPHGGPRRDYREFVSGLILSRRILTRVCFDSREGVDEGSGHEDGGGSTYRNVVKQGRYSAPQPRPLDHREPDTWQVKEAFELLWIPGFH